MEQVFTPSAGGVLVPTATLDKTGRTLLAADFRKVERFMQYAGREHRWLVVYHCATCRQRIRMRRLNRITEEFAVPGGTQEAPGGDITLVCDCTIWTVR